MTRPDDSARPPPLMPEQWARVRSLVEEALVLPADERRAFVELASHGDAELRMRVERLVDACGLAEGDWGFLARPAGELAAPLLAADGVVAARFAVDAEMPLRRGRSEMAEVIARLRAALDGRYSVDRELATGGMATVYLAVDVRHDRRVAIKVLHPELSAIVGAERFLSEIRTTAALNHPHILPLFDSGTADGLLWYAMPLIEGESLRARLVREKQLPITEAIRIVCEVAGALEYAHGRGIVHRDIKPENILLHGDHPLVADFGIALAVQSAGAQRLTRTGLSLGTPPYMSPEQAAGGATIDGRSDVYSLACVLYELIVGDPPFTGSTPQVVIARILADPPPSVRTVRPSVPAHVEAALARALAKLPADRHGSAREFAESLRIAPVAAPGSVAEAASARERGLGPARAPRRRDPVRIALGAAALIGLASAAWMATRAPGAPIALKRNRYPNLIDQSLFASVTMTPDGGALVYTGIAEAGRPIMLQPLDRLDARVLRGTSQGTGPFVAPDGRRLMYHPPAGGITTIALEGVVAKESSDGWRYGNGAWDGSDAVVIEDASTRGLGRGAPGASTMTVLTRPDTVRGESKHLAPLVLRGQAAVVFTVSMYGGKGLLAGPLAIASLDPGGPTPTPHVPLGIDARRAFAFVDGWLLYLSADGRTIMAVRLDVARRRIVGSPIVALEVTEGHLESAALADNGSLLYVRRPRANSPVLVDSNGVARPVLAGVDGPFMYPRVSPDGRRIALQASTPDGGNDVWVYDVASGAPTRLTTAKGALHPTWTPDGRRIVFMAAARRGLMSQPVAGGATAEKIRGSDGGFAPMVSPDGAHVVYQRPTKGVGWTVWSASLAGDAEARRVLSDQSSHYMPDVSPDGRWLADVSGATGRNEVYVQPFPGPGSPVQVSDGGGSEPAWSPDGRRIYYRTRGAFMVADLSAPSQVVRSRKRLFDDTFDGAMPHRNYDVLPDGSGFLMITGGTSEAVVVENWLSELRIRLAESR